MRKRGRPRKNPTGRRVSLGLRVTAEMKKKIEEAADKWGRSQSQQAELMLEQAILIDLLKDHYLKDH